MPGKYQKGHREPVAVHSKTMSAAMLDFGFWLYQHFRTKP